jgi:hypothetical protein
MGSACVRRSAGVPAGVEFDALMQAFLKPRQVNIKPQYFRSKHMLGGQLLCPPDSLLPGSFRHWPIMRLRLPPGKCPVQRRCENTVLGQFTFSASRQALWPSVVICTRLRIRDLQSSMKSSAQPVPRPPSKYKTYRFRIRIDPYPRPIPPIAPSSCFFSALTPIQKPGLARRLYEVYEVYC